MKTAHKVVASLRMLSIVLDKVNNGDAIAQLSIMSLEGYLQNFVLFRVTFEIDVPILFTRDMLQAENSTIRIKLFSLLKRKRMHVGKYDDLLRKNLVLFSFRIHLQNCVEFSQA